MMKRRKGTIQQQRINHKLLNPDFEIDDRSFEDLLAYVVSYVEHINFYTTENKIDGNWRSLIEQDPVIYIIGIIKEPIDSLRLEDKIAEEIAAILLSWYKKIEQWYHTLLHFNETTIANKISNVLLEVLWDKKVTLEEFLETIEENYLCNPFINSLKNYTSSHTNREFDLEETAHTFRKMVVYIQNFTRKYLHKTVFSKQNHMPNNAMYITFAILFNKIQTQINSIAQKHLDFYYKDILLQTPNKGIPTQTVVCFELSPKSKGVLIPENTTLLAGKLFDSKKNIVFETTKPLLTSPIVIDSLQNLYLNKSNFIKIGTKEPTIANILQHEFISNGKPQVTDNKGLFGADENSIVDSEVSPKNTADIGFIIGSQVLFLEEGEREIKISFFLEKDSSELTFWKLLNEMASNQGLPLDVIFNDVFEEAFNISYTSKEKWIEVKRYYVQFDEIENTFTIILELGNTMPPVTISSVETAYTWPMLKVELSELAPIYAYSFFKGLQVEMLTIDVHVSGIKDLSIYNNMGKVSLGKPFYAFSPTPKIGDTLLIGKSELYQKEITDIDIIISWDNLPSDFGGFESYYNAYSQEFNNNSFQVTASALSDGYWFPLEKKDREKFSLFETQSVISPEGYNEEKLVNKTRITLKDLSKYQLARNYKLTNPIPYNIHTNSGFLKLSLSDPEYAFGKDLYQKEYTQIATYNAKNNTELALPNIPFSPKIKGITLNYTAKDVIYFNNAYDGNASSLKGDYIHLTPFGKEQIVADSKVYKNTLVTDFKGEGYLYFKLKKVASETSISLFFDVNNSTPTNFERANNLIVEYKKADRWVTLPKKNIISDSTHQLSASGIIEILIPRLTDEMNYDNFELRFVALHDAYKYPTFNGIYTNAVVAVCTNNDENVIGKKVEAGNITKLGKKIADIKKVVQPQSSFGGKTPTIPELFYTEVSERIRHKDRALTIWDYEHLILQQYHEIATVKCTNKNAQFKPQAGKVTLVVLSKQWQYDNHHYFNNNELFVIQQFIKTKSNSFIKINVQNPTPEWLLVTCVVQFDIDDQGGYYIEQLNKELNEYLCPVSNKNKEKTVGIGGSIVPRTLKTYLENLSYIQSIKKLEIEHIIKKGTDDFSLKVYEENQEIQPTLPWSMLVPKLKHNIYTSSILEDETIEEIESQNFRIGVDYIIADDHDFPEEENTIPTSVITQEIKPKVVTIQEKKIDTILNFNIE
ncbi:phage baseplate protein [Tenacibaculum jejuense]|uniref:Phage baseplate protein n=2 Tax=Tenacibaculum jejuense TaxID=584609 RepID=A0A238U851_9FLAO|nr:phage baseplate protein [Tenacibaculum jejuense]